MIPHPATPPDNVRAVTVKIGGGADDLLLTFIVDVPSDLRLPAWSASERSDGLWHTTCFELFLQRTASDAYWEFNFSPSTRWAAYEFTRYRQDMRNFPLAVDPQIDRGTKQSGYVIEVDVDLSDIPNTALRMGLSAVIEEKNGRKSYWALAHPGAKPDFHHPDSFTLELPAAETP